MLLLVLDLLISIPRARGIISVMCVSESKSDGDIQALSKQAHNLQTFLVIRSARTHENLDLMGDQLFLDLLENVVDAVLEGSGDG